MTPSQTSLRPGDVVAGRYRIEGVLGQGGFGTVFRATQLAIGRSVALKMLLPDLVVQDEGLQRFKREAQLAQRLEHPNTVRLYDFGQSEQGVPFIAFELLKGESLDQAIRSKGRMTAGRVARIAAQVLKSLMEAHALGIVHRDIKPPNIFLCDFQGEPDFVKVLDFGIAKATNSVTSQGLTQSGHVVGTPHYMPPEHLLGNVTNGSGDLYALGLVMAEALTAEMVYRGGSADVCLMQISPDPVPLQPMVLQSPLGPVILRATQKELSRRYGTAAEMLHELEALVRAHGGELDGGGPMRMPAQTPMGAAETRHFASNPSSPSNPGGAVPPTVPAGAQYAGPPPPQQPYYALPPAHPPAASGGGGVLIAIVVALALLVAVGGAGAYFVYARGGSKTGTSGAKKKGKDDEVVAKKDQSDPKKKPGDDDDDDQGEQVDPADVSPEAVKGRLTKAGWEIVSDTTTHSTGLKLNYYYAKKKNDFGSIYHYVFDDPQVAKSSETAFKGQKSATRRKGNTVVMTMVSPDQAASQDLLDEIFPE